MGAHAEKPVIRAPGIDDRVADKAAFRGNRIKVRFGELFNIRSINQSDSPSLVIKESLKHFANGG